MAKRPVRPVAAQGTGQYQHPTRRTLERAKLFVAAYLADRHLGRAAIAAGFAESDARNQGYRMMQRPEVRKMLDAAYAKLMKKLDITRETIAEELARVAFSNVLDYGYIDDGHFVIDLSTTPPEALAAISELNVRERTVGKGDKAKTTRETRLKLAEKRPALVDLGKHIGMFRDDGGSELTVIFNINGREQQEMKIARTAEFTTDRAG